MKGKSVLGLLLSLIIIAGSIFIAYEGIGPEKKGGVDDINLGLDLAGGVSITYTTEKEDPTAQEISDTRYKLRKRIDEKGYTEGEVYLEGDNRINVDIPGVKDANKVLLELGKPGNLEFTDEAGNVVLSGEDIKDAIPEKDTSTLAGGYLVRLELNSSGAKKFEEATGNNVDKIIYIKYNGEVISAPTVNEKISGGSAVINGMRDLDEANNLATNIRIGALPLKLVELRSNVVGAKMGHDAINTSVKAGIIGILLIFAFMIVFYRMPGLAATLALAFYAALTIICISIFGITLTLPGIAGIILSVGMAVDANIIIFSRIQEELAMDKTLRSSIKAGFKKATSAILDGNITTLIAAVVLFMMGTGPIKGFAQTLGLGIIISMFTALVVTRIILNSFANIGIDNKALYGVAHKVKGIKVIELRKVWFLLSVVVIGIGLVMMPVNKGSKGSYLNYDIEFVGGTSTLVTVGEEQAYDSFEALRGDLNELVGETTGDKTPQFQNVEDKGQFIIKTQSLNTDQRIALQDALIEKYGITTEDIESESISSTVSKEMRSDAIKAVLLAAALILVYVTFRFKDFRFGVSAVIALVHDILVVLAVYSLLRVPINNSFIAAMLTIVGYSINDTIVLFDRVRENMKHMKRGDYIGVVDVSISQTLSRSINTSLTTFLMVLVLYIIGVASIREFALPLMVGIISGTYSSIFIASPLWYLFRKKEEAKIQKAHSRN